MQRFKDILAQPLYQPIEHPAFAECPVLQPCVERWRMIADAVDHLDHGSMIDVGCHTGWFCRQFARRGWKTFGIDRSETYIDIAREMVRWTGYQTDYTCGNTMKFPVPKVDVALCLSVVMYFFDNADAGWDYLNRVSESADMLFMDFGGMYAGNLPFDRDTVAEQMIARTKYRWHLHLGDTDFERRPLFLFAK